MDGLRVDAVASMLYLDYSRKEGQWVPNRLRRAGGPRRGGVPARAQRRRSPRSSRAASRSRRSPPPGRGVTAPVAQGGLGFTFKWNMGWMHDTLNYFALDPVHRRFHHEWLTFAMMYEYSEHFIMPLSHDEVVHGKGTLLAKMPGDQWQKFRQPPRAARLPVHPARQAAAVHGQPSWARCGSGTTTPASTGIWPSEPLNAGLVRFLADLGRLYRERPEFWRERSGLCRLPVARRRRPGPLGLRLPPPRRRPQRGGAAQPHAGAATRLPGRRSRGGALVAAPVERRAPVRRERLRPGGGRPHRARRRGSISRPRSVSIFRRLARSFWPTNPTDSRVTCFRSTEAPSRSLTAAPASASGRRRRTGWSSACAVPGGSRRSPLDRGRAGRRPGRAGGRRTRHASTGTGSTAARERPDPVSR